MVEVRWSAECCEAPWLNQFKNLTVSLGTYTFAGFIDMWLKVGIAIILFN